MDENKTNEVLEKIRTTFKEDIEKASSDQKIILEEIETMFFKMYEREKKVPEMENVLNEIILSKNDNVDHLVGDIVDDYEGEPVMLMRKKKVDDKPKYKDLNMDEDLE
jgi:hypothetical protein